MLLIRRKSILDVWLFICTLLVGIYYQLSNGASVRGWGRNGYGSPKCIKSYVRDDLIVPDSNFGSLNFNITLIFIISIKYFDCKKIFFNYTWLSKKNKIHIFTKLGLLFFCQYLCCSCWSYNSKNTYVAWHDLQQRWMITLSLQAKETAPDNAEVQMILYVPDNNKCKFNSS